MININYRDSRPIYEQIIDNFKKQIISGTMEVDDKLPSVRDLAMNLAINPNTITRAYRELEQQGYIYSIPGKGSYVAPREESDMKMIKELKNTIKEAADELKFLGVTEEEIIALIQDASEKK